MGPAKDTSKDLYLQLQELYAKMEQMQQKHDHQMDELENYCEAKVEKLETKLAETTEELRQTKEELSAANATIAEQKAKIQVLTDDNERMKRILNNDSNNSSLPPSSGGPGKPANTYNSRTGTNKKPGAQTGHEGKNLSKAELEEKIKNGKITCCEVVIGTPSDKYITRYRVDLEVKTIATKYIIYADANGKFQIPDEIRADVTYGPTILAFASLLYSEGVVANDRICNIINSISGNILHMATGTVYGICKRFGQLCAEEIKKIENNLLNGEVIMTDATPVKNNGKQSNIRNFSNDMNVLFVLSPKKCLEVLKTMVIFQKFAGIFVHDHETAIYNFGLLHGECNVHLARYLLKNTQETSNSWSHILSSFLFGMNAARKTCIENNETCFSMDKLERYEKRFDEIMALAKEQHKHTEGTIAYTEETRLINRILKYRKNHLLFLHDFRVPFGNNMSERDLRKCKNRQKMAGGFRNEDGITMFCNIMSVVETLKRRKMNILEGIASLFAGRSVLA